MPPLFMVKVLGLMLELVTAINHFAADFNGHFASVNLDGNFHLAFSFRSDFAVRTEGAGSGTGAGVIGLEMQKHPDGTRPFEC